MTWPLLSYFVLKIEAESEPCSPPRCLPVLAQVSDEAFLGLVHLSAFLNALAGVVYLSAPATLSAAWFPPEERAMATAGTDTYLCDPYGRGKGYADIKFTVPFQYKPLVLKRNFKIAVNKKCSTTIRVPL